MEDAKSIDTPVPTNGNLERDENGKDINVKRYRGMTVSLLYLTTCIPNVILVYAYALDINLLIRNHI